MKYKLLGRSGMRVSEICFGAMTFGEETGFGAPKEECRKMYDTFVEVGGNFIDTADLYGYGISENMLGDFIGSNRDRIVLATKFTSNMSADDPNGGGNQKKHMVQALEHSLKRLNTDYVDVYWIHHWDFTTPIVEVMRALDDQVRAGKVLHIGASNTPAWVISYANAIAEERGWTPFSAMQLHYNLVERSIESDFFALANAQDMVITPWSPLAGGLLTGKFDRDADKKARKGSRIDDGKWPVGVTEEKVAVSEKASTIAREIGQTTAQVALKWMMQHPSGRVVPIAGARNLDQLKDNLGATEFDLTDEQLGTLNEVSAVVPRYPASLLGNPFMKRMIMGNMGDKIINHHDPR